MPTVPTNAQPAARIVGWKLKASGGMLIEDSSGFHTRLERWVTACCELCPDAVFDLRVRLGDRDGVRAALLVRDGSSDLAASAVDLLDTHLPEYGWQELTPPEVAQWRALGLTDSLQGNPDMVLLERTAFTSHCSDGSYSCNHERTYVSEFRVVSDLFQAAYEQSRLADALQSRSVPLLISVRFRAAQVSTTKLEFAAVQQNCEPFFRSSSGEITFQRNFDTSLLRAWRANLDASAAQVTITIASHRVVDAEKRFDALLALHSLNLVTLLFTDAPFGLERITQLCSAANFVRLALLPPAPNTAPTRHCTPPLRRRLESLPVSGTK